MSASSSANRLGAPRIPQRGAAAMQAPPRERVSEFRRNFYARMPYIYAEYYVSYVEIKRLLRVELDRYRQAQAQLGAMGMGGAGAGLMGMGGLGLSGRGFGGAA